MGGEKESKSKLNNTLRVISKVLNDSNINWFIGYGTLLGIVRDGSCIDGDDDIDIIIDISDSIKLNNLLIEKGFKLWHGNISDAWEERTAIIKTHKSDIYSSIDFYCAITDNYNNFFDSWEGVVWSNCKFFIQKVFQDTTVNLPNNYIKKLINRYGENWKTPQDNKGIFPRNRIL